MASPRTRRVLKEVRTQDENNVRHMLISGNLLLLFHIHLFRVPDFDKYL